ncbi:hypothetical protein M5D96_003700 [Drosophila gunungcola]|uniref:Uncharacterized protein n=1 Tax=Drosophila gunungcola TaxID=103775 RepID=A0A9P9YT45_9MUSC|nr:hypothetical protein M5D96_003700 [Drosophila gunungcola]
MYIIKGSSIPLWIIVIILIIAYPPGCPKHCKYIWSKCCADRAGVHHSKKKTPK